MFIEAIEKASEFTRPIYTISRHFDATQVIAGTSTLFFINDEGWALTCGHVAKELISIEAIKKRYEAFQAEINTLTGKNKKRRNELQIEKKYGLNKNETIQAKVMFVNCTEGNLTVDFKIHPQCDVALIKFNNFNKLLCNSFPVFPSDTSGLKTGKMLCRLGFPFPEFTNFMYNQTTEDIEWTQTGRKDTPIFPIEGMVTRHLGDNNMNIIGFEMSTPGLKGQSGGPAFDKEGKVWGMQSSTKHIDLDFDVKMEVIRQGQKTERKDNAFLHVGQCVHVNILKQFMLDNGVSFKEE